MRGARALAFGPVFALIVISACSSEPPTGGTNQGPATNGASGANAPSVERSRVADVPLNGPRVAPEAPPASVPAARIGVLSRTGLMPGEIPFDDGSSGLKVDSSQCGGANLVYQGGPLMMNPTIYEVSWTANVNATLTAALPQFYADITSSSYWDWLTEYDTVGLSGGSNQTILHGSFGGAFTITPSRCNTTKNCNLTDAQIQSELLAQITAGSLPAPTKDCAGQTNSIYMIDFPPNISITDPGGAGSCVAFGFCAYHGTASNSAGQAVPYGVLPDVFSGGCATGCGANKTLLNNATSVHSHELAEATTDTNVGLATVIGPPLAWYDPNCGEIGDICNAQQQSITTNGRTWTVQQLWSNLQTNCVVSGSPLGVCSGANAPPGCRLCSCGDTGGACNGSTAFCETDSTNVDFGACEQCTATSQCAAGDSCAKTSSKSTDDKCSGCTPKTCQAGQCGSLSDGCGGTLNCGNCTAPQTCGGGGTPNQCGCTPKTCQAGQCGSVSDGCGGNLSCGNCTAPQTCGGGGTPNQCGCTPSTCQPGQCGSIPNGCGGTLNCGGCTAPQTCGGAGTPNQCGCTPTTCQPGQCGSIPNGCGGTLNCGGCTAPQTCGGAGTPNQCGCTPSTCQAGQCGSIPNGCGATLNCGGCTAPQTCGGAGTPNQCGCTPSTCQAGQCGSVPDGCGSTLSCGGCGSGQSCVSNQCVANTPDSGAPDSGGSNVDSGTPPIDSGTGPQDSGTTATDSGVPGADAGRGPPPDASTTTPPDASTHGQGGGGGETTGSAGGGGDSGGAGGSGCSCRTATPRETPASMWVGALGTVFCAAIRLRRRSRRGRNRAA